MKLSLMVNGADALLEIAGTAPHFRFQIDAGPSREALVEMPEPGVYSVLLDGRSFDAFAEPMGGGVVVTISGRRFEIEVRDPRRRIRNVQTPGAEGRQSIVAAMPGKVVRVLVSEGDEVRAGAGIVVVEAMKMQNEMRAGKAGRVAALPAREGAAVAAGEMLAIIE